MSDSIIISINKSEIGCPRDWNALLKSEDIPISISDKLEPLKHTGYIQCLYEGKRTGFEFEIEDCDSSEFSNEIRDIVIRKDSLIFLTLRDGIKSALAASSIAAAIVANSSATIIEPDEEIIEPKNALSWAKNSIEEFNTYEIHSKEAKKEARKLKKSQEKTRERLVSLLSSAIGFFPVEGYKMEATIAFKFKNGDSIASISTADWEFGKNDELIQESKSLLATRFSVDEEKAEKFFPTLEKAFDDKNHISELKIESDNTLYLVLDNGYYLRCFPKGSLSFNSAYLRFTIYEQEIEASA